MQRSWDEVPRRQMPLETVLLFDRKNPVCPWRNRKQGVFNKMVRVRFGSQHVGAQEEHLATMRHIVFEI